MAVEFTKKVDDIIKKKLTAIDIADEKFLAGFDPIERKIFDAVKKKVLQMNIEGGKTLFDDNNVQVINELDDVISDAIASSGYNKKVADYLRSFDTIKRFNFDAHEEVNDLTTSELEDLVNPVQKQVVDQTLNDLTGAGISTQFTQPLKEGIFKNIVSGSTISDLEKYLSEFILSDPLNLGKFKKYTTQIARDTLNQFDGQVNSRIANEFDLNAYKYVGSLIEDSRPQCKRWVNKGTILKEQLDEEINWANSNGSGMIPGTNVDNFAVYRGGYNCRHSAIPFKMTKSQIEKLQKQEAQQAQVQIDDTQNQIDEVKTEVESFEPPKQKAKLNPAYLFTSQTGEKYDNFVALLENQDDAVTIIDDYKTAVGFVNTSENAKLNSTRNFPFLMSDKATTSRPTSIAKDSGGHCSILNDQLNVLVKREDQILLKGYDADFENYGGDGIDDLLKKSGVYGVKIPNQNFAILTTKNGILRLYEITDADNNKKMIPWTITDLVDSIEPNKAPTITHETAHLIHNKLDPQFKGDRFDPFRRVILPTRELLEDYAFKKGVSKYDAPTKYGMTNWSEFYAECQTAYIHCPEWFEKYHKKSYDFFVDLNKEVYNFDLNTLTQYK